MGQSPTELLQPPHKQASLIPTRFTSGVRMVVVDGSWAMAQHANAAAAPAWNTALRETLAFEILAFDFDTLFPRDPQHFGAWINQLLLVRNQTDQRAKQYDPVADPNPAH